jgi:hypothetical protein
MANININIDKPIYQELGRTIKKEGLKAATGVLIGTVFHSDCVDL